jgi:hypothetical protein
MCFYLKYMDSSYGLWPGWVLALSFSSILLSNRQYTALYPRKLTSSYILVCNKLVCYQRYFKMLITTYKNTGLHIPEDHTKQEVLHTDVHELLLGV